MENKSFLEKALMKAEETMEATPEYKSFEKAKETKRKTCKTLNEAKEAYDKADKALNEAKEAYWKADKATDEAWKAVEATPEYKPYNKAFEAYRKTFMIREFRRKNNE